jgi:hypothetical protein
MKPEDALGSLCCSLTVWRTQPIWNLAMILLTTAPIRSAFARTILPSHFVRMKMLKPAISTAVPSMTPMITPGIWPITSAVCQPILPPIAMVRLARARSYSQLDWEKVSWTSSDHNEPYGLLLRYIAAVGMMGILRRTCAGEDKLSEWCGNYLLPEGPGLTRIFEDIASRIFTRIVH